MDKQKKFSRDLLIISTSGGCAAAPGVMASALLTGLTNNRPLQLAIHVVQNRHAGEQKWHWENTNKGNYHLKSCMPFVCLIPVRLLLSSVWRFYTTWMASYKGGYSLLTVSNFFVCQIFMEDPWSSSKTSQHRSFTRNHPSKRKSGMQPPSALCSSNSRPSVFTK